MTLTEAAYWTKRLGFVIGGGVIIFVTAVLVIANLTKPDPIPQFFKADYACTITAEEFKSHALTIPTLSLGSGSEKLYTIETATGRLEQLPRVAYVYKYSNSGPSLNAQGAARTLAGTLGMDEEKIILRGGLTYDWAEDSFGRSLSIDVSTLNFTFKTNFVRPGAYPSTGDLPTDPDAVSTARAFLRGSGYLLEDYAATEPQTKYINIEPNGTYSEARSKAEAELIRVDFFRTAPFLGVSENVSGAEEILGVLQSEYQNYESTVTEFVTPDGRFKSHNFVTQVLPLDTQKGNISVYIGPSDTRKKNASYKSIYAVDYVGWVVEPEKCGTYDLISATEVTTIIQNGNASLVYLNEVGGDSVIPYSPKSVSKFAVNSVILAYLDKTEEQTFMQPIYIVIGEATLDNGITGKFYYYIPAINYNVIQDKAIEPAAGPIQE